MVYDPILPRLFGGYVRIQEMLTLNGREQNRLKVLHRVERGGLKMKEAGKVVGLSLRQVRRLRASYQVEGCAGLAHGRTGGGGLRSTAADVSTCRRKR